MTTKDYLLDVALGNIPHAKVIHKFGRNPTVSTGGAFDAIWNGGGTYTGFPEEIETVSIVSTSSNDTSVGTGARVITIYGLDANFLEQEEEIILNGLTPVVSTLVYSRLPRARVMTAGSIGYNEGNISIAHTTTVANVFAVVPATCNTTMIAAYTIPANKNGHIIAQAATIANKNAASVEVRLRVRQAGSVFTAVGEAAINSVGTGYIERTFVAPQAIPPKTDIYMEATATKSVSVSAFLDILLEDI